MASFLLAGLLVVCLVSAVSHASAKGDGVILASALRKNSGRLDANMNALIWSLNFSKSAGANIFIWPEFAINFPTTLSVSRDSLYPLCDSDVPQQGWAPDKDCNFSFSNSSYSKAIGCAARSAQMYVSVNVCEIVACSSEGSCPADGHYLYNSELVFSDKGVLVAKYHKSHPWYEKAFDAPPDPSKNIVTFNTNSFGRFGVFTCKDILFAQPGDNLVQVAGVSRLIYSVAVSALGSLGEDALEFVQKAWTKRLNATLFASNLGTRGGSGIFVSGNKVEPYRVQNIQGDSGKLVFTRMP